MELDTSGTSVVVSWVWCHCPVAEHLNPLRWSCCPWWWDQRSCWGTLGVGQAVDSGHTTSWCVHCPQHAPPPASAGQRGPASLRPLGHTHAWPAVIWLTQGAASAEGYGQPAHWQAGRTNECSHRPMAAQGPLPCAGPGAVRPWPRSCYCHSQIGRGYPNDMAFPYKEIVSMATGQFQE